jgi:hypothetical protein
MKKIIYIDEKIITHHGHRTEKTAQKKESVN